jgi:hypothetical protein
LRHAAQVVRACDDLHVPGAPFQIRLARDDDRLPLALLFAAVAEERDGIATSRPSTSRRAPRAGR